MNIMSPWVLYIMAALDVGVMGQYIYAGRWGLALVFFAYAVSTLGFVWDAR